MKTQEKALRNENLAKHFPREHIANDLRYEYIIEALPREDIIKKNLPREDIEKSLLYEDIANTCFMKT
jgi:hypothetical protein